MWNNGQILRIMVKYLV